MSFPTATAPMDIPIHPKPSVSASVVLSPRETKHYRRWQRLCTTLSLAQQGGIPSAVEYEDFKQWLKRQDSGYFSDAFEDIAGLIKAPRHVSTDSRVGSPTAVLCQHTMHPAAVGQTWRRCPVCTIDMHIQYLRVLKQALESAGGRAPTCTLSSSEHQDDVYRAWMYGKICALNELSRLERIAELEAKWSVRCPQTEANDLHTAEKALQLYWSEIGGLHVKKPHARASKAVLFSQETDFEPGRPTAYFWQKSPRYEHGKYTNSEPNHDDDEFESPDSLSSVHRATYGHEVVAEKSTSADWDTEEEDPERNNTGQDSEEQKVEREVEAEEEEDQETEDDDSDSDCEDIVSDEDDDLSDYDDDEDQGDFIVFGED